MEEVPRGRREQREQGEFLVWFLFSVTVEIRFAVSARDPNSGRRTCLGAYTACLIIPCDNLGQTRLP